MKGKAGETRGEIGIKSDWIGQNVIYFPNFGHFYFPAEGGGKSRIFSCYWISFPPPLPKHKTEYVYDCVFEKKELKKSGRDIGQNVICFPNFV